MTTDELLEWIRQQLQAGFSEDDIKKTGLAGGWAGEDINEAFAIIEGSPPLTIAPMPEPPVMPAPPEEVPTAEESAVRVSEAEPTEDTATQAPQKRRWPLVAFAVCILLVGSAAAAFMLVPGVRSFVLGRAPVTALPTDKTLAPTSNIIADAPILLNPTESTSPSSPQKTPLSATVEPVITSPVKQGGITPPPSSVTAPSVDTTAPIVSLSAPASGATVSGSSVAVSASASDKVGVVSVQLKLDGSNLGSADTVAPYSVTWDTKKSVNGKHTLSATAKDAAGNIGTAVSVTVTVNNVISTPPPTVTTNPDTTAPAVSVSAPTNGTTVLGSSVAVSATASDNVGVAGVQFKLDGANLGAEDTTSSYGTTWDSTTASNGTHTLSAIARDAAGNQTTSSSVSVTVSNAVPDTTAPTTPANLSVTVISSSQLNLSWSASTDAVGVTGYKLERCTGSSCTSYTEIATPSGTSYNNTGLTAATTYRYRVRATDAAGNLSSYSTAVSGTTQAAAPTADTTDPTVSLSAPNSGATVSGSSVAVSATAADNIGVVGVQFKLDGANLGAEDTVSPYSTTWNTTSASNGTHTLSAVARDAAGNQTTSSSVSVTVSNTTPDTTAPTVSLSAPSSGATVSGSSVSVSASASDNVGIAGVQFKLDGVNIGSEDISSPYTTTWNTTSVSNGTHTLTAVVRDAAGNQTTSSSVSVTVSNAVPDTTAPTTPANLSVSVISSSQLNLSWSASTDAVGVTGYKLERCTGSSCTSYTEIATPSGTSYNNTGLTAATTYRYRVRATDAAGNLSSYSSAASGTTQAAAPASVTVSMGENAYSPANLTIAFGTTVIFRNDWSSDRWPASDSHPSHNIYPAFDSMQAVQPGGSWSFTFTQVGQWGYHDHLKPSIGGYITVQ